jgi:hypothetical protein
MNASLVEVDSMIGSIVTGLEQRNLTDIVNLIIVVSSLPYTQTNLSLTMVWQQPPTPE